MKFKYGNYTFAHNPTQADKDITAINDNVMTLSGRVIAQPTFFKNSSTITSTFYQPRDLQLLPYLCTDNVICFNQTTNQFYTYNLASQVIKIYNANFLYISSINCSSLALTSVDDITSMNNSIYLSASNLRYGRQMYVVPISTKILSAGNSIAIIVMALANDGNNVYILDNQGNVWIWHTGSLVFVFNLNTTTTGLEYSNGFFFTVSPGTNIMNVIGNDIRFGYQVIDGIYLSPTLNKTVESLCFKNSNILYYIDSSYNSVKGMSINTVNQDIFNLSQQVKSGIVSLSDQYGRTNNVVATEIDIKRLDKLVKSYQVTLKVEGVF
jgi:hypothetical protein